MPIGAISFDLDDTLWDIAPVIEKAEQLLRTWLEQHCPDTARQFDATAMRTLRQEVVDAHPQLAHDLSWLRKRTLRLALQRSGDDMDAADSAFEVFISARHDITLYPDAIGTLQTLSTRYALASISNGNADVERIGLHRYFQASVSAHQIGVCKPHPNIFTEACSQLARRPDEVVHIGDHPEQDVLGAANAGLRTIWVNRTAQNWSHPRRPDAEVQTLAQIPKLLAQMDG
ncbi:MAG: HAD-IA family hydrolase [Gammaproteobacteria bacterium]|nr:HAD-IA family hydrolase [Gammaproteobacteria bacterium]